MKSIKEFKIKELILHNFALKILAIIIAVVSWIVIVNIDNPSQRITISGIPVTLINQEALSQKGYIFQVESGSTASIVIKAPRNIAEQLRATDFYAYADLSERSPDSDKSKIYVSCVKEGYENQVDIVNIKTEYLQLSIDNKVDKNLPLDVVVTGSPSEGYVVGEISTSPTSIRVSGAENTISRIESAKITYNVDNMNTEIDDTVSPVFYDADGRIVSADKLELSRQNIKLKIDILPTKTIEIKYIVSGEPQTDYELSDYSSDISKIVIAGKKELLDQISSLDIPSGVIDATGATQDRTVEVPLAAYLPSGYFIVSEKNVMKVKLSIDKYAEKTIKIPVGDITVNNADDRYDYTLTDINGNSTIEVTIRAIEKKLDLFTEKDLEATVDVSVNPIFTTRVNFKENSDFEIKGACYVKISRTLKETESETEPDTTAEKETTAETTEPDAETETTAANDGESYVSDGTPREDLEEETGME